MLMTLCLVNDSRWEKESQKYALSNTCIFGKCQNVLRNLWMSLDKSLLVFKNSDTSRMKIIDRYR